MTTVFSCSWNKNKKNPESSSEKAQTYSTTFFSLSLKSAPAIFLLPFFSHVWREANTRCRFCILIGTFWTFWKGGLVDSKALYFHANKLKILPKWVSRCNKTLHCICKCEELLISHQKQTSKQTKWITWHNERDFPELISEQRWWIALLHNLWSGRSAVQLTPAGFLSQGQQCCRERPLPPKEGKIAKSLNWDKCPRRWRRVRRDRWWTCSVRWQAVEVAGDPRALPSYLTSSRVGSWKISIESKQSSGNTTNLRLWLRW